MPTELLGLELFGLVPSGFLAGAFFFLAGGLTVGFGAVLLTTGGGLSESESDMFITISLFLGA